MYRRWCRREGAALVTALARLDHRSDEELRSFACTWGLLGLLQHGFVRQEYVATPEGRVQSRSGLPHYLIGPGADLVIETIDFKERVRTYSSAVSGCSDAWRDEQLEKWRTEDTTKAYVLTREAWRNEPVFVEIEQHHNIYFPYSQPDENGGKTFPSLHTAALWDELCETLGSFSQQVKEFQHAFRLCGEWQSNENRGLEPLAWLLSLMRFHLHGLRPAVVPPLAKGSDGEFTMVVIWPSLLAAAYYRFYCDNDNRCANPYRKQRQRR